VEEEEKGEESWRNKERKKKWRKKRRKKTWTKKRRMKKIWTKGNRGRERREIR
jgi:hypothetical protein